MISSIDNDIFSDQFKIRCSIPVIVEERSSCLITTTCRPTYRATVAVGLIETCSWGVGATLFENFPRPIVFDTVSRLPPERFYLSSICDQ